jgi:hypothetical protein
MLQRRAFTPQLGYSVLSAKAYRSIATHPHLTIGGTKAMGPQTGLPPPRASAKRGTGKAMSPTDWGSTTGGLGVMYGAIVAVLLR